MGHGRHAVSLGAGLLLAGALGAQRVDLDGAAPREFRAAWIASVANIDWPSKPGLPVAAQQAELVAILDRAAALRLNALVFQVRPMCDALYPSQLEPWSSWLTGVEGQAPDPLWDPLQLAVDGAHERGMELHAWFNPFRARHRNSKAKPATNHVERSLAGAVVTYAKHRWLDPGSAAARGHTVRVVLDVLERYDVDGIHLDDYFYPYPEGGADFPDGTSWRLYRGEGGSASRGDWRRRNVDRLIQRLDREIHRRKPWVKFGISPFGIARPGVPEGIEAGLDQYDQLYADVVSWWQRGWCDYLAPQLYWPVAQKAQSFPVLLRFWAAENTAGRHLWPGLYTSKTLDRKPWPVAELVDQIRWARRVEGASGHLHFSMKALMGRVGDALLRDCYPEPALVPASPWLDAEPPAAPAVETELGGRLRVVAARDVRWVCLYERQRGGWRLLRQRRATAGPIDTGLRAGAQVAVAVLDAAGNGSQGVVVTLR